jgi:mono/diheme cytochrome c family protein
MRILTLLSALLLLALAVATTTPLIMNPKIHPSQMYPHYTDEQVTEGNIDYGTYCTACHGPDAQGLEGLAPILLISENVQNWSDAELHTFIVNGRAADHPDNVSGIAMPARGGFPNLRDDQIDNIIASYGCVLMNKT